MVESTNEVTEVPSAPQTLAGGAPPELPKEEIKAAEFKMPKNNQESLSMCKWLKEQGNEFYKQKEFQKAISKYARIRMFSKVLLAEEAGDHMLSMVAKAKGEENEKLTEAENKEIKDIVAAGNLNMSICFFNLKNYPKSKEKASESLNMKKSIKAYYRRAQARAYMKDYDGACDDLKSAIKMDTNDPNDFQAELIKYEKYAKAARKSSDDKLRKAMKGGLFGGEEPKEEKKPVAEESKEEKPKL